MFLINSCLMWQKLKKIHPRILKTRSISRHELNFVDSFAVYVRADVAFVRLNFSLFQGPNATVIRVYRKWIHPLLLMGCTTILSCSDCIKGFHQQTARQLKTMQWRAIQIAVFTRAWQNYLNEIWTCTAILQLGTRILSTCEDVVRCNFFILVTNYCK